ncbi:MAG: MBL fold metallo-hydrolase [Chitinophagales bacterium]
MLIKIYPSAQGDCLLINSGTKNILIDGGMSNSFSTQVSGELAKMRTAGRKLDLVCVSHIDADHIAGILKMIEDEVEWRVYNFQSSHGNTSVHKPKVGRPPEIRGIWHNAFHEVVPDNTGEIEDMLAAHANILSASSNPIVKLAGEIALGEKQAIQLSKRLRPDQLNIPLNKQYDGKLVMVKEGQAATKIGNLSIQVIAPFEADLKKLRTRWNTWLKANKKALAEVKADVEKDAGSLSANTLTPTSFLPAMANKFTPIIEAELANKELGKRSSVTAPNLASIMFLVKEGNKTALMTGDGHWEDILKGLEAIGELDPATGLHVNVLKVQHHGAAANIHPDFCNKITADKYIFCGNGEHENPEVDVIKAIIDSRTTKPAITDQAKNNFTLLFNSSSAITITKNKAQMKKVEQTVKQKANTHANVKFKFMTADDKFLSINL